MDLNTAQKRQVTIVIDQLGRPKIEAHGFYGQGCEEATAPIERALAGGNGVDVREFKPERYNEEQQAVARQVW